LCLAAVIDELKPFVGARVQRVYQWDAYTIGLGLYKQREAWLLVSCDARYARMHLMARRLDAPKEPPSFCMALRKHLSEARLEFVRQRGLDRVVDVGFSSESGDLQLVVELMGKHSNIALVDGARRVLAAAKVVGTSKSRRPVVPGREYLPPPFEPRRSLLEAGDGEELADYEGASPFLRRLISSGLTLETVQNAVRSSSWSPSYAEGHGGYPLPLTTLFANAVPRESASQAIEQAFAGFIEADRIEGLRSSLLGQLRRVLDARNVALIGIEEALDVAGRARELQEQGELILAYQHQVASGDKVLAVFDYSGKAIEIKLNPETSPIENAPRLFA
jgi:predicted ribosome quality control (RQC) complex YloA/Tae2 family protein